MLCFSFVSELMSNINKMITYNDVHVFYKHSAYKHIQSQIKGKNKHILIKVLNKSFYT